MSEPIVPAGSPAGGQARLPAWVYKRDGRLVPFDADRISQSLFAASETLGRPDAFLARELADGILHFLAKESSGQADPGAIPTTAQIADLVAKVIRELGQVSLAQAFIEGNRKRLRRTQAPAEPPSASGEKADKGGPVPDLRVTYRFSLADPPAVVVAECLREYGLRGTFSRDLVAAHRDGLLNLTGLEAPCQLAGCIFDPGERGSNYGAGTDTAGQRPGRSGVLVQALQHARQLAGNFLVIDSPELALSPFASARDLAKNAGELLAGLDATDLVAIINLNAAEPPHWAEEHPEGPLFAEPRRSPVAHLEEYRAVLLEQLLRPAFAGRARIDWHLGAGDFTESAGSRLDRLARQALDSSSLSFVFDRPNQPVPLAEGVDRKHPAVLLAVGLNLPHLVNMLEVRGEPESFLQKMTSLSRLAVSAGVQKRNYLRQHDRGREQLARGFLLDRARLVAVPIGLDAAVRGLVGHGIGSSQAGLDLAEQVVASLAANLRQAGVAANLDVCLDGLCQVGISEVGLSWSRRGTRDEGRGVRGEQRDEALADVFPPLSQVAGITPWDATLSPKDQLRAAGALHGVTLSGTAAVLFPPPSSPGVEELLDLLAFAWKNTEVTRVRFVRAPERQEKPTSLLDA